MTKLYPVVKNVFILIYILIICGCGTMMAKMEANKIETDPGTRTIAQRVDDQSIETKAIVNIHDSDGEYDKCHLVVVSYNGFVLLAGQVTSEALKIRAAKVIREIPTVKHVYNELEIAAPSSKMTRTSDAWITTKIKSKLLANPDIPGLRVKVVTENGVVFLLGLLNSEEAKRVGEISSEVKGVQRIVQLFETI
tara:strand:- start:2093 stop:2674 length:582 start_codon:yes stop_codon:yes gene_type:complete